MHSWKENGKLGLVIDFDVLSTYCYGCNFAPGKEEVDDDGNSLYDKWFNTHEDLCDKNFDGTPQAMEQALWRRSVALHDLKYGVCFFLFTKNTEYSEMWSSWVMEILQPLTRLWRQSYMVQTLKKT
jgi:hypothetical protein